MKPSEKIIWNLYATAVGALTAVVAQRVVKGAWRLATGEEPPEPSDPDTPTNEAVIWALASGIGIGITQLLMSRFAANRWQAVMGTPAPKGRPIQFRI